MQDTLDVLEVGLRVLTATISRTTPDPTDVEELRQYAPQLADAPLDELACQVIKEAGKHSAKLRQKAMRSGI